MNATAISVSLIWGRRSWSVRSRRLRTSPAKLRSTTHLRGWTAQPCAAGSRPTISKSQPPLSFHARRLLDRLDTLRVHSMITAESCGSRPTRSRSARRNAVRITCQMPLRRTRQK